MPKTDAVVPRSDEIAASFGDREMQVEDILQQMSLDEEVAMLGGTGFASLPLKRLGIPEIRMADGPVGVRWGKATSFPSSISLAAAWDTDLAESYGRALARETMGRGRNMILGPCVNIHRVPYGGRNFESFGEDPYLAARTAVAYILGVQGESVIATVKHFACNNQEFERNTINAVVDERTLHEIYFPAFRAAVQEAGCWSVMGAYNKLNGDWCCESHTLLTDVLKTQWGFRGFVVSDWDAVHTSIKPVCAGLDIEMPHGKFMNSSLVGAVRRGEVNEATIDDHVRRLLRAIVAVGIEDTQALPSLDAVNCHVHVRLARVLAASGMVLLKNDHGVLPLDPERVKTIAVIGPNADVARTGGGGSSFVTPFYAVSPLEGIQRRVNPRIRVVFERGCPPEEERWVIDAPFLFPTARTDLHGLTGEYFDNQNLEGMPILTRVDAQVDFDWSGRSPAAGVPKDHFSIRWTGRLVPPRTGDYVLVIASDDGMRLFLDGEKVLDHWGDHALASRKTTIRLVAGRSYDLRIEYYQNNGAAVARCGWLIPGEEEMMRRRAVDTARAADEVIVCAGLNNHIESECYDHGIHLPANQDALIAAVVEANPRTIVVLNSGEAVLMERWIDRAAALIQAWYPGEQGGNALADILFGDVNPSGKLPTTFPRQEADVAGRGNYPGRNGEVHYAEGLLVGYRHFDAHDIEPLFPFGHGLSYTTFTYRNLTLTSIAGDSCEVRFELVNGGRREGAEVVQVYVNDLDASVMRPPQELKAFRKLTLNPGESRTVSLRLGREAFSFYDPTAHAWRLEPGRFRIRIGSSSRDIRLNGEIDLTGGVS